MGGVLTTIPNLACHASVDMAGRPMYVLRRYEMVRRICTFGSVQELSEWIIDGLFHFEHPTCPAKNMASQGH